MHGTRAPVRHCLLPIHELLLSLLASALEHADLRPRHLKGRWLGWAQLAQIQAGLNIYQEAKFRVTDQKEQAL